MRESYNFIRVVGIVFHDTVALEIRSLEEDKIIRSIIDTLTTVGCWVSIGHWYLLVVPSNNYPYRHDDINAIKVGLAGDETVEVFEPFKNIILDPEVRNTILDL